MQSTAGSPGAPAEPVPGRGGFRQGLRRSREQLVGRIRAALAEDKGLEAILEGLEQALIESDIGVRLTERLLDAIRALPVAERTEVGVRRALRSLLRDALGEPWSEPAELSARPWVCLVVGVNGVGKTTTIGKLAARHRGLGRSVLLVAGDTFRAAAIEQLSIWAGRTGADLVRQEPGADPSSVTFDGMRSAVARSIDTVLIDTAGRLHTKANLMEELKKVRRVIERVEPGAPHEVLLVLDATTGQNALAQAVSFMEAVAVSGVVLTKVDGSARGGIVLAVRQELGLPVRYIGLGEGVSDLRCFDPDAFVDGLLPES
jgi:fused signal recognition particle receptor